MAHVLEAGAGHAASGEELEPSVHFMWQSPSARENGKTAIEEALEQQKSS